MQHDFDARGKPLAINMQAVRKFALESLNERIPVIPEEAVGFYKHNCMVCFHHNGHKAGVTLTVNFNGTIWAFQVYWTGELTPQIEKAYREPKRATEFAACAITLILVRELTQYTAVEQSCIGTTIDYYLSLQAHTDDLIFNHTARLEVSGILVENEDNKVEDRIKRKIRRLKPKGDLLDLIAVVEFSKPWSKIIEA